MGTAIASLIMIILGLIAVALAFEMLGRAGDAKPRPWIRKLHKVVGYLFMLLFLLIFAGMASRFEHAADFSAGAYIHAALAIAAFVLLVAKWLIVRRYKKLMPNLFFVGGSLFILSFTTVALMIGVFIGGQFGFQPDTSSMDVAGKPPTADFFGKKILPEEKILAGSCADCHPIGQVLYTLHNEAKAEDWDGILKRMQEKGAKITDQEAAAVAAYFKQFYQ